MPSFTAADTIRILVSTDNHVGYNERDPIRGDDSWKSFDEVMRIAKERDVDMVLLAGDLFHDNKPSRKAMYHVMQSLRSRCYGEKPCELEMLSDASEQFAGAFNHVNYEDPDINVAIPVFSIHGNHDDPAGEGHLAALDILQMSGLLNYYGRTPESDNILVKPVLLQKGNTKLALYGMSNVRDERLFRTFRDGNVKFFQAGTQKDDWFNLMSVHQNHHAYTETGYLPENFLPDFLDLVVWGHEHECLIDPKTNPEMGFRVMQPGSSVATSLVPGEAVPKHVAILSVRGKSMDVETIRLKSVRPFMYKEIVLADDKTMQKIAYEHNNQPKVHAFLIGVVERMIRDANQEWLEIQQESGESVDEDAPVPLPLIRLRIEYTAPEGGKFEIENPQRFSNRFVERVANSGDVVQYHRKRLTAGRATNQKPDMPEQDVMAQLSLDNVKVEKLVEEFLTAQSLTILPQNSFSDAVGQFVDKDDKYAMESFLKDSLETQVRALIASGEENVDDDEIGDLMEQVKATVEREFQRGGLKKNRRKRSRKPKPAGWDSEMDGEWENDPASIIRSDEERHVDDDHEEEETSVAPKKTAARGQGAKASAGTTRKMADTAKQAPAKAATGRGKKKQVFEDEDDDDDVIMLDDDDDDDEEEDQGSGLFVSQASQAKKPPAKSSATRTAKASAKPAARGGKSAATNGTVRQSQLNFATQTTGIASRTNGGRAATPKRVQEPSDDEISDDDAFEPPPPALRNTLRRR